MDRERLSEQEEALDELAAICDREGVEAVLVAGDVFDTYLPPADAEEAFYRAVKKLAGERRAVVVISGNHDDGVRLAAAAPFAEREGVYLFGNRRAPAAGGTRPVHAVRAGENFVELVNPAGERVYINALPYPNEARLKEDRTDESFGEKTARWISAGDEGYDGSCFHILLTHLFVAGGRTSDSERNIDLGGARAVPLSSLPKEGYVALGHLHRRQSVGENCYYSGSLLQYSFDEANTEKGVYLLETDKTSLKKLTFLPLSSGKKLVRLEACGVEEALRLLPMYEGCFAELTLRLTAPLTARETQSLREANDGLVSLIASVSTAETPVERRSSMGAEELFTEYYRSQYGEEPPASIKEAFLELLGEDRP